MSERQGLGPEIVLPVLRHTMGRVFAYHGHNVRVRRVRRHAVLQRTSQGVYIIYGEIENFFFFLENQKKKSDTICPPV